MSGERASEVRITPGVQDGPRPKVSVLVTTYNHERYLEQALESALAQQTTCPFEIVVGEDCSTDGTRAVLERLFDEHPDVIRMVLPRENLGPNQMYVEVMRAARGDYFAILDGDDYWVSVDKLERQARLLDSNDDYQVCFHDVAVVTEGGGAEPRRGMPSLGRETFDLDDILLGNFVPAASVMHRRVDVDDLPNWFTEFAWIDWLMLVVCAQKGLLQLLPGLEAVYRVHSSGLWAGRDRAAQLEEEVRVYEQLESALPGHGEALAAGLRRAWVQLAVEQAGLGYDRPVAVLSHHPELPWYLNGRAVSQLPTDEEPIAACIQAELDRMRRLPANSSSVPHWRTVTPVRGATGTFVYFVIESPVAWFERLPKLRAYLQDSTRLHASQACAIYELPCQTITERRIVAVQISRPPSGQLQGGHIDSPEPGTVTTAAMLELVGWALGRDEPAVSISVTHASRLLSRAPLGAPRPDLAAAFPDVPRAARAGFRALLDLANLPDDVELVVTAELAGDASVTLGVIRASLASRADPASDSP